MDTNLHLTDQAALDQLGQIFGDDATVASVSIIDTEVSEDFILSLEENTRDPEGEVDLPNRLFVARCGTILAGARLCALVFNREADFKEFLERNPGLRQTLVSRWFEVSVIWVRVTGKVPSNFMDPTLRWYATGLIPVGCPDKDASTFIPEATPIQVMTLDAIKWTDAQRAELRARLLMAEVGPPFIRSSGRKALNPAFWAHYFAETFHLHYEPLLNRFGATQPGKTQAGMVGAEAVEILLAQFLEEAAALWPDTFPPGEICPRRIRQIFNRVKLLSRKPATSEPEILDRFLKSSVAHTPERDQTLTSRELWVAYVAYCNAQGVAPGPEATFYPQLRHRLRMLFGVGHRHDIQRQGRAAAGYSHLTFSSAQSSKPEAAEGTETTEASLHRGAGSAQ